MTTTRRTLPLLYMALLLLSCSVGMAQTWGLEAYYAPQLYNYTANPSANGFFSSQINNSINHELGLLANYHRQSLAFSAGIAYSQKGFTYREIMEDPFSDLEDVNRFDYRLGYAKILVSLRYYITKNKFQLGVGTTFSTELKVTEKFANVNLISIRRENIEGMVSPKTLIYGLGAHLRVTYAVTDNVGLLIEPNYSFYLTKIEEAIAMEKPRVFFTKVGVIINISE